VTDPTSSDGSAPRADAGDDPYGDAWWPPGCVLGWVHAVVHENCELLSAIGSGEFFHPSFRDAYAVQRVLDAVERSDEAGEWIDV
jgi:predicted dehydrogenase